MPTRQTAHAEEEKAIFEAFLTAHPAFAKVLKEYRQPDAEFPDVVVTLLDSREVDFELGEWIHGGQMGQAKRRQRLTESLEQAIGPQGPNHSPHFRAVMLTPRDGAPSVTETDKAAVKAAVAALIEETDRRWPGERFWHSPQGRICGDLAAYPPLGKYLGAVHFDPLVVRGETRPWAAGQPWIFTELPGGSYSPETSFTALGDILSQKISHYGRFSRPTRLVVYYGKAVVYNTPYIGVETREFADVAARAAGVVHGQKAFEKIYLLNALEPGLEVFEIYPACARCT